MLPKKSIETIDFDLFWNKNKKAAAKDKSMAVRYSGILNLNSKLLFPNISQKYLKLLMNKMTKAPIVPINLKPLLMGLFWAKTSNLPIK